MYVSYERRMYTLVTTETDRHPNHIVQTTENHVEINLLTNFIL